MIHSAHRNVEAPVRDDDDGVRRDAPDRPGVDGRRMGAGVGVGVGAC